MNKRSIVFYASTGCFVVSSLCILMMPTMYSQDQENKTTSYLLAGLFWGLLAVGILLQIMLHKGREKVVRKSGKKPAFFSFGSNRISMIFEIVFALSLVVEVILLIIRLNVEWLDIALIFSMILSFEMHCIFVGENYKQLGYKLLGGRHNERI